MNDTVVPVTNTVTGQIGKTVGDSTSALQVAFHDAWTQAAHYAPNLLAALAVLVIGYFVARFASRGMISLCERVGLQRAAERGELAQSMRQVGIQWSVPQILGAVVFWGLIFVFLMATFNLLGLSQFAAPMQDVVNGIPKVLVATFLVVVGLLVATLLRGFIATSADRAGLAYAQQLANGGFYVLVFVTFWTALKHLGVNMELLTAIIQIAAGGAAVAFALAFGLGGRDVVSGILAGYYLRQRMQSGDHVRVAGMEGTVREVGPVATIVETIEDGLMHRHSVPNTKMLNEAIR
ncbi:MAG: mechanosensitive ion channel [Planctomycetia bacterium]|nr:mechanosensitive ion channel [Planctomycetia bacterium]